VSNGFGNHPTGLLTVALFEALRGEDVHVELFATGGNGEGPIGDRLRAATQGWYVVAGLAPDATARRIHASDLDVLVDLRGWGDGGIAEALALRPAPLQVNWLAYPGTSGAPWIGYVIADRFVLPARLRDDFSEGVAWLPRCFQPSDPTRIVAEPPPRASCGLPERAPVFVCFNNSYKLNQATFARLAAVLRSVPDAVLWLLSGPADGDDRLRAAAQADGVDPARLVFMPRLPHDEYLARFRHADVFLDTDPYNAHTTASDALWAGGPVLTTPGETFAARVAGSLNHHLGMDRMNRDDDADFVDFATRIGRDANLRAELRAELDARRRDSGLFDMTGFARDFAALLRRMVERRRAGLAPAHVEA
jgi:predicted O-linked N-acetylglucosamine transferase (SPINDLY family)